MDRNEDLSLHNSQEPKKEEYGKSASSVGDSTIVSKFCHKQLGGQVMESDVYCSIAEKSNEQNEFLPPHYHSSYHREYIAVKIGYRTRRIRLFANHTSTHRSGSVLETDEWSLLSSNTCILRGLSRKKRNNDEGGGSRNQFKEPFLKSKLRVYFQLLNLLATWLQREPSLIKHVEKISLSFWTI